MVDCLSTMTCGSGVATVALALNTHAAIGGNKRGPGSFLSAPGLAICEPRPSTYLSHRVPSAHGITAPGDEKLWNRDLMAAGAHEGGSRNREIIKH